MTREDEGVWEGKRTPATEFHSQKYRTKRGAWGGALRLRWSLSWILARTTTTVHSSTITTVMSVSSSSVQQRLTNFYILLKGHFPRNTMIITPLQFHPLIPPPLHPNHHHYHPSSTIKPLNPPTLNIFWWVLWVSFIKWTPADSSPPFWRKPAALIAQNIWQAFHNHHHQHHHQQQRKRNYYVLVIPIHQQKQKRNNNSAHVTPRKWITGAHITSTVHPPTHMT